MIISSTCSPKRVRGEVDGLESAFKLSPDTRVYARADDSERMKSGVLSKQIPSR